MAEAPLPAVLYWRVPAPVSAGAERRRLLERLSLSPPEATPRLIGQWFSDSAGPAVPVRGRLA